MNVAHEMELARKRPLDFEELRPAEPYSNPLDRNWEADARNWKATSRDWETVARIFYLRAKVATSESTHTATRPRANDVWGSGVVAFANDRCEGCLETILDAPLCKCSLLPMVDDAFREELESLRESPGHVEHPLPRKLPTS